MPGGAKPAVSIVVPVYQGEATIGECVKSLLAQDYPEELVQIIVVDNNSTDNTAAILEQNYRIDYLFERTPGAYVARNTGIESARHQIIAFTDADCVAKPDWLPRLCEALADAHIAGGKVQSPSSTCLVEEYIDYRKILQQEKMAARSEFSLPFFVTANCAIRREVFEKIGVFDPFFKIAGDADLCWRAQRAGFKLRYVEDAVVVHKHRSNLLGLFQQSFDYGFGRASLFKKHHHLFEKRIRFDWKEHVFLVESILRSIASPFLAGSKFDRMLPILDTISFSALVLGKLWGSVKRRTLVI